MALIFYNISQGMDLGKVDQYSSPEHHICPYVRKNVGINQECDVVANSSLI